MKRLFLVVLLPQVLLPRLMVGLVAVLIPVSVFAETATVAVASNFMVAMRDVVHAFEQETDHTIQLASGSSGKLYAQILNGAPFDVFLSADQSTPQKLFELGLAVPDSHISYAQGALVLWSRQEGLLEDKAAVLKQLKSSRLAFANPRLAPYGRASVQVLAALGLNTEMRESWVRGENIAQTFQFVYSGNATLGFIALSQWSALGDALMGSSWLVPQHLYEPIQQDAVLLLPGENKVAARSLMSYLQSEQARKIIQRHGYSADPTRDSF